MAEATSIVSMTATTARRADRRLTTPRMTCGLALVVLSPTANAFAGGATPPATIELTGVVRDFLERNDPGGHPDFEQIPFGGYGHFMGNVAPYLDSNGKPVFTGSGYRVDEQWRDATGRPIARLLFDPARGDVAGTAGPASQGGIESAASFEQWYEDVPGVNLSTLLGVTFVRQANGAYVFSDTEDELYRSLGGFFPIEDRLFGNPGGSPDRNFHFTFELHTRFTHDASASQVFSFLGDDDVWVFIDGRLVIDLGGVHRSVEQHVELDRLGLTDGEEYTLDFFYAERHRTEANFRITTNIQLRPAVPPSVTDQYD